MTVIVLVGVLLGCSANDSDSATGAQPASTTETGSPATTTSEPQDTGRCAGEAELAPTPTVLAEQAPTEVHDRIGDQVVGDGSLWALTLPPPRSSPDFVYRAGDFLVAKFGWYRLEPGPLEISGRDTTGQELQVYVPEGYPATGFQPVELRFPSAGCWVVVAHLNDSEVVMHLEIVEPSPSPSAVEPSGL